MLIDARDYSVGPVLSVARLDGVRLGTPAAPPGTPRPPSSRSALGRRHHTKVAAIDAYCDDFAPDAKTLDLSTETLQWLQAQELCASLAVQIRWVGECVETVPGHPGAVGSRRLTFRGGDTYPVPAPQK